MDFMTAFFVGSVDVLPEGRGYGQAAKANSVYLD